MIETLAELLDDFKIVNSVGENLGKVKEVFFDLDSWMVSGFEMSPGFFKKDRLLKIEDVMEIKYDDKQLLVSDQYEGSELPSEPTKGFYPFDELKKKTVIDNQGEKVGKIYNMEIPYEKLKNLKVWKVLVKTGFKERRLRIAPMEIGEVMDEITLRKALDEYKEKLEGEP